MMADPPEYLLPLPLSSGKPAPGRLPLADYRRREQDNTLIEEYWWGELPTPLRNRLGITARSGWVWARFWLRDRGVVLDRIYDSDLQLVGTHIDVITAISVSGSTWQATDLLLDIWLTPGGRVTILREDDFDESFRNGHISLGQSQRAEEHVRDLTRWIAAGEFPPPWIQAYQPHPDYF